MGTPLIITYGSSPSNLIFYYDISSSLFSLNTWMNSNCLAYLYSLLVDKHDRAFSIHLFGHTGRPFVTEVSDIFIFLKLTPTLFHLFYFLGM